MAVYAPRPDVRLICGAWKATRSCGSLSAEPLNIDRGRRARGTMLGLTGGVRRQFLLVGLLLALLVSFPALAEKRIALVIGNGAYMKAPMLPNPRNDAASMAELLRKAGFDVVEKEVDLGADAMRRVLRDFSEQARDADIAIVFYAGHGMEMNGVNYLIPIDATIARDVDVEDETVSLDRVIRTIEPARRLQLVILDSCRDNPFVRSMRRTFVSRSVRSGHADIDEKTLPPNSLIAYAQKAGATADDGTGSNSPYTTALLKHLATPGLDVELALRRVRDEVLKTTRNRQEPFKYGSLGGSELPLVPSTLAASAPTSALPSPRIASEAALEWAGVDKTSVAELETFISRHSTSSEAEYARARLNELRRQNVVVVNPPSPQRPVAAPHVVVPKSFVLASAKELLAGRKQSITSFVTWSDTPQGHDYWAAQQTRLQRGGSLSQEARAIIQAWIAAAPDK